MEQTRYVNLPIVGRIQHGEKVDKKVIELGHFIAKIQDIYMQTYLEKFDKLYKGKKSIDIEFFCEEPLSMKYVRYNQSGEVCSCMIDSNIANLKIKNGWQQIQCNSDCPHRQKNEYGKSACNRIGWLKFLIPSICKDRIFLMKITGQTSLNRLNDYFNLQKFQGNSVKGNYTLFLKQEEQSNSLGQSFTNYVLDIFKNENFISEKTIPQITEKTNFLSIESDKNVNNNVVETHKNIRNQENINNTKIEVKKPKSTKKTTAIQKESKTQTKAKKHEENKSEESNEKHNEFEKYYIFDSAFSEVITDNKGNSKEYLIGKFYDMEDKVHNIVIRPEDSTDIQECELGTIVELDVQDVAQRKFAVGLKFIDKIKKIAA